MGKEYTCMMVEPIGMRLRHKEEAYLAGEQEMMGNVEGKLAILNTRLTAIVMAVVTNNNAWIEGQSVGRG